MKLLGVLATILTLSCVPVTSAIPGIPKRIQIMPHVAQAMVEIQREYEVETVKCLLGFIDKGVIYVESMEPVWIIEQSANHVVFNKCTGNAIVGWFHNHPPDTVDGKETVYCSITSPGDINTIDYGKNFWIAIVSCDKGVLVYRFKLDATEYRLNFYN